MAVLCSLDGLGGDILTVVDVLAGLTLLLADGVLLALIDILFLKLLI